MRNRSAALVAPPAALALAAFASLGVGPCAAAPAATSLSLPGLAAEATVITDAEGTVHITAANDFDLFRVTGWVHARDRFFQMDLTRREVSGDRAEVLGESALDGDIQNRTIGLRRAAERSFAVLSAREQALLQTYADGVNAYLDSNPLPPEYAQLELTEARPWSPIDTLAIGKGIAASLSLDIDATSDALDAYIEAGTAQGFDGEALFFQDVRRNAPMDPASTVPDATSSFPFVAKARKIDRTLLARAARGSRLVRERLSRSHFLAHALDRRETWVGSNEWGVAGFRAVDGLPIIANDPHLSLDAPSTFYELHLVVTNDPETGPANVNGIGFPGAPGVILGQNEHITWGATTNPMDVTDIFIDTLQKGGANCPAALSPSRLCIFSEGEWHRVDFQLAQYQVNDLSDGLPDTSFTAPLDIGESVILTVPFRSFGPVVGIEDAGVITGGGTTTAFVLQFTGFHATREVETFLQWNRSEDLADFLVGLADFDFGSQNWAYADREGNLGYFASGELPLRRDLEDGFVHGLPPAFFRDGSGPANWVPDPAHSQGQTIPFAVLPAAEMPQALNPANGFFANANNDPAGTTLDNDPLNQFRPSKPSAIYYLSGGYDEGLRAGRITRLIRDQIEDGHLITPAHMKRFQSNTQQLDAELMVPFVLDALENAQRPGAPAELAALAADPAIQDAVARLAEWDFSTPTGIPEGYDARDLDGVRSPKVYWAERRASVAATIYNLWRAKAIRAVIDARLSQLGVPGVGAGDALKALHHLLVQDPYTGVGGSGVDFFPEPAALAAPDRRDLAVLAALRTALDAAASNTFAPAFGNSTDPDDWRWGKLHRVTFDHPLDPASSIPPQAGFTDLAPGLTGLSRDGGYEVVNASGFSAKADGLNSFKFGGGPVRRYVGRPRPGAGPGPSAIQGWNVVPGGPSAIPGSPFYATQLGDWLTADYHNVLMGSLPPDQVQERVVLTPGP